LEMCARNAPSRRVLEPAALVSLIGDVLADHTGANVKIAEDQKYPSRADAGRAFTAGHKLVLAKEVMAVDAAVMLDTQLDEQAAREHAAALMHKR